MMKQGFTLVEVMVTVGIFVFFSILVLVENNKFNDVVLLRDLSYSVALSIREAQVYGLGVREFDTTDFAQGYGVNFNVNSATTYDLFADGDNNGLYGGEGAGGFLNRYNLTNRNRIADFCVTNGGNTDCAAAGEIDELHVTFKRPTPDARIRVDSDTGTLYDSAEIILESPRGDQLSIIVQSTGQITVP